MAVNVYLTTDVAANIAALAVTILATSAADGGHNTEFVAGALAMARGLALAHRCDWPDVFQDIRLAVGDGQLAALDAAAVALLE